EAPPPPPLEKPSDRAYGDPPQGPDRPSPPPTLRPAPASGGVGGGQIIPYGRRGVIGGTIGSGVTRAPDGSVILPFGPGMNRPTRVSGRDVAYTAEARSAGVEGAALVKCVIQKDGAVTGCQTIQGVPTMDAAIVAALSKWRMTPVLLQGSPVAVMYTFVVKLRLDPSAPSGGVGTVP
ncbi:MAG TPA: energy transducer TonB, partial [Minicystis sp.]|nr:energy transducer TonB [Minicystis sp.]